MASCGQSCANAGSAVRHQARPAFLKLPINSFFRVHTDNRVARRGELLALLSDVLELGVALRRRGTTRFSSPGVSFRRAIHLAQQPGHGHPAGGMSSRWRRAPVTNCAWPWDGVPSGRPPFPLPAPSPGLSPAPGLALQARGARRLVHASLCRGSQPDPPAVRGIRAG